MNKSIPTVILALFSFFMAIDICSGGVLPLLPRKRWEQRKAEIHHQLNRQLSAKLDQDLEQEVDLLSQELHQAATDLPTVTVIIPHPHIPHASKVGGRSTLQYTSIRCGIERVCYDRWVVLQDQRQIPDHLQFNRSWRSTQMEPP